MIFFAILDTFIYYLLCCSILNNVRKMYIPMLWFRQSAMLTEDYANMAKMLLVLPSVGIYTGYGMLSFGILLLVIVAFITLHSGWKKQEGQRLLPQQT